MFLHLDFTQPSEKNAHHKSELTFFLMLNVCSVVKKIPTFTIDKFIAFVLMVKMMR